MCWSYEKSSPKPLLSARGVHLRSVKNGLVKSIFVFVQKRSFEYELAREMKRELERLVLAGYSSSFIFYALLASMTRKEAIETGSRPRRVIVPYFHRISNNVKSIAKQFRVETVFGNDFKLSNLHHFRVKECLAT